MTLVSFPLAPCQQQSVPGQTVAGNFPKPFMMICLSLSHKTPEGLLKLIQYFGNKADILEIRVDLLSEPSKLDFQSMLFPGHPPVVITNRMKKEGGGFKGDEKQRIEILEKAAEAGADFIDIEFATSQDLRASLVSRAKSLGCKVIMSFHDFEKTPDETTLLGLFSSMASAGADVVKIVTMARDQLDFFNFRPVFQESRGSGVPVIAFCMGEKGGFSRVVSPLLGGFLTFAAPDSSSQTAPGQIPLEKMRRLLAMLAPQPLP